MGAERWLRIATRHRTVLILVALLSTFAGADLLLNRPKGSDLQWFAIPFLAIGAALFAWAIWPFGLEPSVVRSSLSSRLLHVLTVRGRLMPYFPIIGIAVVVADLAYNAALSATPALLTEDTIVLLGAGALISYGFVPARFARERDFVLMFFVVLNAILVVPLVVARLYYADFERSVDLYSWVALAPQTSAVLNLLGVSNTLHSVPGTTAPGLTFQPQNLAVEVTVVITTACSGIYSFGIFASAFIAFVTTEYERSTQRVWGLLGLGLLTAYVANVLRMVVIVMIGYYAETAGTDLQNMLLAHSYAGWLIFLGWIALFWGVLF
ncbi:MAG: exosortase/archaeosortase family protein, partial [Thermoplasmata archaeon]